MESQNQKAYIYPNTSRNGGLTNPYIFHFIDALEENIEFVNRNKPSVSGILDLLKYINKINFLFLNWPEEIPGKKGGTIQVVIFFLCINYLKLRKVKIIYTLHNKESHNSVKTLLKRYVRKFIMHKADLIITHALEGVDIVKKLNMNYNKKVAFFHHPVLSGIEMHHDIVKKYDVLIWGTMEPYKGIDTFISFVNEQKLNNIRILIAGRIPTAPFKQKILSIKPQNIDIIDKFISNEELKQFISESKAVLFTYFESSILSSGALMDSLRFSPLIIAPHFGAFSDLAKEGIIYTYSDNNELRKLLQEIDKLKLNYSLINKFIAENSWKDFGKSLYKLLDR